MKVNESMQARGSGRLENLPKQIVYDAPQNNIWGSFRDRVLRELRAIKPTSRFELFLLLLTLWELYGYIRDGRNGINKVQAFTSSKPRY
jgi:hypothetical protein